MGANNRVNSDKVDSDDQATTPGPSGAPTQRPRWWLRNPAAGVLSAAVLGVATVYLTASFETPDPAPGSTLLYLVVLPIALLLPAIAAAGVFVAWQALRASRGRLQLTLAAPAAVAMVLNATAVYLFVKWLAQAVIG